MNPTKKRLSKEDKRNLVKKAQAIAIGQMAENKPRASAVEAFKRPPYQTISVLNYLDKKKE